jgi:hypothetical protein
MRRLLGEIGSLLGNNRIQFPGASRQTPGGAVEDHYRNAV